MVNLLMVKEKEIKNNSANGKGIEFYKNGNILYEGDFINDLPKCIIF